MATSVIILGGGVAGMSAAHELIERGFQVDVYELKGVPGGKARSIPISPVEPDKPAPLPGEHGFRFFPRFYKHITDTMRRTPTKDGKNALDHLTQTSRIGIFRAYQPSMVLSARFPRTIGDLIVIFKDIFGHPDLGLTDSDIEFFSTRIWQLITSCYERRMDEYEKIAWWDYIGAGTRSLAYQTLLATGISRSLVASKAEYANTKTDGDVMVQLIFDMLEPGVSSDRVLDGPTSEVWLQPWLEYLTSKGVRYHTNTMISSINFTTDVAPKVASVSIIENGERRDIAGDYVISALPVERMADLVVGFPDNVLLAEPAFQGVLELSKNVAWMNGMQFYLTEDVPIIHGHAIYIDSPWALTSISQKQFWPNVDLQQRGDGQVKGILSIDISDWGTYVNPWTHEIEITSNDQNTASLGRFNKKHAFQCTPDEIAAEVWQELQANLNADGQSILPKSYHEYFLDPDIVITPFYQYVEDNGDVTLAEVESALGMDAKTAEETLDFFVERGLVQTREVHGVLHITATNPQVIQWIRRQSVVNPETLATHLKTTSIEARQVLKNLVEQKMIAPAPTLGSEAFISNFKLKSASNLEPLLVNLVDTWKYRPTAATKIPNLFLASDYVRTNTDLATMEGANEAARRAVNGIIGATGANVASCKVWELHEPAIFWFWRSYDLWRYKRGLPWTIEPHWLIQLLQQILLFGYDCVRWLRGLFGKK